jgi:hypothetical protein
MSTHAIMAVRTAEGYKGRYVHFDGYTEAMLPAMNRAIKQCVMGGTDPIAYMLGNHWSAFNLSEHKQAESHTHDQTWYTQDDSIGEQYLYIIDETPKKVQQYTVTPYIKLGDNWIAIDPSNTIKTKIKENA